MKPTSLLALAAVMSVGLSAPALADYVRLGSVDVGYRIDRDTSWNRFGGGMEGLRLMADRSDIGCRSIVVQFADGSRQDVFHGKLRENQPVDVDLRGGTRHVRNIAFTCRSNDRDGGKIFIAADVGRFKDEWRRSTDWDAFWSHTFNWGPAGGSMGYQSGYDPNSWMSLGQQRFEGRRDVETAVAGWGGRSIERVGLKATNDDAVCSRIVFTYGNGGTRELNGTRLSQGRFTSIDLPGGARNLSKLTLACHAVNRNAVSIEVFTRK